MPLSDLNNFTDTTKRPCPIGFPSVVWDRLEENRIQRARKELARPRFCFGCGTRHPLTAGCPERVLRGREAAEYRAFFGDFTRRPTWSERLAEGMAMLSDDYEPR